MLKIGDVAPDFTLPDQSGTPVSLRALLARGPVLLYFYPADATPICTAQACMVRDSATELESAGVQAVGISAQSVKSKRKFADSKLLSHLLLADVDKRVANAFGVRALFGLVPRRASFLIDPDTTIVDMAVADLSVGAHEKLVHRARARYARAQ